MASSFSSQQLRERGLVQTGEHEWTSVTGSRHVESHPQDTKPVASHVDKKADIKTIDQLAGQPKGTFAKHVAAENERTKHRTFLRGVEHRNAAPALPKEAIGEVGQRPKVRRKQASGVPMKSKSTRGSDAPPQKLRKPSAMEAKFERLWQEINGPALTPEFKFHPSRRWRFDFACERAKIAVELDGGVWGGGRHTRGAGFIGDCEKGNAACALGWRVWHLATGMVTRENLMQIRAAIAWHDEGL